MNIKRILRFTESPLEKPPPLVRVRDALIDIGGHTTVLAWLLFCLWVIESLVGYLWGKEKVYYGKIPISWIFDTADLVAIVAFLVLGIVSSLNTYRNGEQQNAKQ